MRRALDGLSRWIGSVAFGKRLLFSWQEPWACPSGKIYAFAFDDDYSMGVLSSRAHSAWAWRSGATLKADLSYPPTSTFAPFPWPEPTADERSAVAEASRRLVDQQRAVCLGEQIGLTTLYNRVDDGAYTAVRDAHRRLDEAVGSAYGWPARVAHDPDEIVRRLLSRHGEIVRGERSYDPFGTAPAIAIAATLDL